MWIDFKKSQNIHDVLEGATFRVTFSSSLIPLTYTLKYTAEFLEAPSCYGQ